MSNIMPTFLPRLRNRIVCIFVTLLVSCLMGIAESAFALDADKDLAQCHLDNWTTRDGLPPREIECMAQTPDGYLWLATRAGLARFDGATFRMFDAANTPGWTRGMVRAVAVSATGQVWVGTDGDGFGTFQDGRYTRFALGAGTPKWSETTALCAARDGSLWVGGQGEHSLLRLRSGRAESVSTAPWSVCGLAEDKHGVIWIATGASGLHVIDKLGLPMPCSPPLPASRLTALCAAQDGSVWVGTENQGLWRLLSGKWTAYTRRDGLATDGIRAVYEDKAGNLWVSTRAGLHRRQNGRFQVFDNSDSRIDPNDGPMLEDREGNLWVGTGTGLSCFSNTKLTPFELAGLKGATINSACQTEEGSCWFATSQGLARVRDGLTTIFTKNHGLPPGVVSNVISSVWAASNGALWLITEGGGLHCWRDGHFTTLLTKSSMAKVAEDRDGLVLEDWNTLYRLQNGRLVPIPCDKPLGYIFTFCLAPDGTLWFGCEQGLGRVRSGKIELFQQGLPENTHVLAVTCTSVDEQWLGTDKGLARFAQGKFTLFNKRDGLPDDNLYQVLTDQAGALWIGGNRGIFSVSRNSLQVYEKGLAGRIPVRLYEAPDGIRRFPLAQTALKTRDGRLWFKGDTGMTIVDPRHVRCNTLAPPVLIEQAVVNGIAMNARKPASIAPGKGEMEVIYTAPSLTLPHRVRFRYKLEGYDREWVTAETRRVAFYTNLPPGTYCFRVMACNNDGVWNQQGAEFTFTLEPKFYQTGWFRLVAALGLACLIAGLIRLRVRALKRANRLLERRIAERTAQLVWVNQDLKASHQAAEAANARLQALATTDGMTMLANHRAFQDRLREAVSDAQVTGQPLTILLADVDHFKQYNDAYGHPAGDEVLRSVARLLRDNTRPGDCVARYGGEEFAVLLPNTDAETALEIAERLRACVSEHPFSCRQVTFSIGAALLCESSSCPATLVSRADQALYGAKRAGRNRVLLAGEEPLAPCVERELNPAQEEKSASIHTAAPNADTAIAFPRAA